MEFKCPLKNAKCYKQVLNDFYPDESLHPLDFYRQLKDMNLANQNWKSIMTVEETYHPHTMMAIHQFINLKNTKGAFFEGYYWFIIKSQIASHSNNVRGYSFRVETGAWSFLTIEMFSHLTDERYGFLDSNGNLKIEIQIRIDKIINTIQNTRLFNFFDPFNDEKMFTFHFGSNGFRQNLYAKEEMLIFHSPVFAAMINAGVRTHCVVLRKQWKEYEWLLQFIHGVPIHLNERRIRSILPIAYRFKVNSVIQKCERHLIFSLENEHPSMIEKCEIALWYNLRHLLAHSLERMGSLQELKFHMNRMNLEKMSSEAMKAVAQKIFLFF